VSKENGKNNKIATGDHIGNPASFLINIIEKKYLTQ